MGYGNVKDAQADLDRIRAILDLAGDDEDAQRRVGDLLQTVMNERKDIPEAAEVSRRLGVGVPLDGATTVGEWLDTWVAAKKTRKKTTTGYESHIRVHLKPGRTRSSQRRTRSAGSRRPAVPSAVLVRRRIRSAPNWRRNGPSWRR
ncbi:hypothetical protein [Streptomyces chryseus]|uniref:hypothetical protein n=1 Tax=Streptomyces chryseus TaxID=68186 RepID=UPI00357138CB